MNWNTEQQAAIKGILNFIGSPFHLERPDTWAITIRGHAGTGKTTMVQEAIRQACELRDITIAVTAPTNKAVEVLKNFGQQAGIIVDSATIYSLLGLVLGNEGEVRSCFQGGEGKLGLYDVVVIDESSMVGNQLMDVLYDRIEKCGTKIIFMGDHCQLNPVREAQSRVFNPVEVPTTYYLTQIMRQDEGNPIRKVVASLREWANSGSIPYQFSTEVTQDCDGVHVMTKPSDWTEAMLDQFDTTEYREDPRFCRALAWTNKEVDRLNRMIRTRLYGVNCPEYVVGEHLAILTPVVLPSGEPVIFTDDECEIVGIGEATYEDVSDFDTYNEGHPTYHVWVLSLKTKAGEIHRTNVIHPSGKRDYQKRLKHLADRAKSKQGKWNSFWEFKGLFTEVRPVHAMTVHKSQGQTFNTIFFKAKDALKNLNPRERASLCYVACSRPTTNLVIDTPNFK